MRFATEAIIGPGIEEEELLPNTRDIKYPQDSLPSGAPTEQPNFKHQHMQSPRGGIAQLAPSMTDGFVDHPAVQDTGLPYIVSPEIQRLRRQSMDTFQGLDPVDLRQFFKGV
jgi:hypothetical protein